jgi:hypothetical protein
MTVSYYVAMYDKTTHEIILQEEHVDHDEATDKNPQTGKRGKFRVTAEQSARARFAGIAGQVEEENANGKSLGVYIGQTPYTPPETPAGDEVKETA